MIHRKWLTKYSQFHQQNLTLDLTQALLVLELIEYITGKFASSWVFVGDRGVIWDAELPLANTRFRGIML